MSRAATAVRSGPVAALVELADLVLARCCAGCRVPGTRWCPGCAAEVAADGVPPRTVAGVVVHSAAVYRGAVREAVNAWKDHGRADLTPVLAGAASSPLSDCLAGSGPGDRVLVVPVPSSRASRRGRGREPVRELARALARHDARLLAAPVLAQVRRVREQPGLDARQRADNLRGALAVRPGWRGRVAGSRVVLVDDVLTSGATLAEAARAVRAAGARPLGAVTVAATPDGRRSRMRPVR